MDLALDTGIFLGYAHEPAYETYHVECGRVLTSPAHRRFASFSVEQELARRVRQRQRLYESLATHVAGGGRIGDFDLSPWNASDASLGRRIMGEVGRAKPQSLVTYLRLERQRFDLGLAEARMRTEREVIPSTTNYVLEAGLRTLLHDEDARNVCEYLSWARDRAESAFVAIDTGVRKKRGEILNLGRRHFDVDNPKWDVLHVADVP